MEKLENFNYHKKDHLWTIQDAEDGGVIFYPFGDSEGKKGVRIYINRQ